MSADHRPLGKTIITGATGMVGSRVLAALLQASDAREVISIGRRKVNIDHPKLTQVTLADFSDQDALIAAVERADSVFHCLSTYLHQVTPEAYRQITVTWLETLLRAVEISAPEAHFCLFSAAGARRDGKGFSASLKVKGEAENVLFQSTLPRLVAVRPAAITPSVARAQPQFGDHVARILVAALPFTGISSVDLASAMLNALRQPGPREIILSNADLRSLATAAS